MNRWVGVLVVVGAVVSSCGSVPSGAPTQSLNPDRVSAPAASVASPTPTSQLSDILADFPTEWIGLAGRDLLVAVAGTPADRRQGLMEVDDLGDLDGMLFVFPTDTTSGFWMKNTLIPLDIAFFGVDGRVVDSFTMQPCKSDPCEVYDVAGPYRFALEMPAGSMPTLTDTMLITTRGE